MPTLDQFDESFFVVPFTVKSGTQLSVEKINLKGFIPVAVRCDAALTGSSLYFKTSLLNNNDYVFRNDNTGVIVTTIIGANTEAAIDFTFLHGIRWLQLSTGSSQAADTVLSLIVKRV